MIWSVLHPIRTIRHRRPVRWLRSRPPGYGEHYGYRGFFDDDLECNRYSRDALRALQDAPWPFGKSWDGWPDAERARLLAPMPDPHAEHTDILTAFKALTACRVCGYTARI